MGVQRRDDPSRATQRERYGDNITAQVEDEPFRQRLALAISRFFQPVYRRLFAERGHFVSRLEERLIRAKISTPVELYLSNAVALGSLVGVAIGGVLAVVLAMFTDGLVSGVVWSLVPAPESGAVTAVLSGLGYTLCVLVWLLVFVAGGVFGVVTAAAYYPSIPIYRRRREIDLMMPDVVGFMYSLSVGGMGTLELFGAVAEAEDTYGEAAVEFQEITHEVEYFNTDYQTAIETVARRTPSDELSRFLLDLLSVINSGGDVTEFLETQKDQQMNERRRRQTETLDTLEMLGEVYISLTVLPLILIVVLVIMALLGDAQLLLLVVTVYVLLPALNGMYFLAVSLVTPDEIGAGQLENPDGPGTGERFDLIDGHLRARPDVELLHRIRDREIGHRIAQVLANPLTVFRTNPRYTLLVSVPVAVVVVGVLLVRGVASPSLEALTRDALGQSFVWFGLPFVLVVGPLTVVHEWRQGSVSSITETLTDDLRQLANANATGQPLLEAMRITGEDNDSPLGREFVTMYKRVNFGNSLGSVLVEFNNRYGVPRLARSVKLVGKAQETSDHITDVLRTAAELSAIEDDLERERRTRTRMQVAIVIISFVVFVGVLVMLEAFFIETIVDVASEETDAGFLDFGTVDPGLLSLLYLHAALIQGVCAGLISGYVQTGDLAPGLKYALGLVAFTFLTWTAAGVLF